MGLSYYTNIGHSAYRSTSSVSKTLERFSKPSLTHMQKRKKTTDIHHCFIHYSCSVATKILVKNPWYFTHSLLWSPVTWRVTHPPRGSLVYILTECPIFSTGTTHTARGPGKRKHEEGSVFMLNREKKPGRLWEEGVTGKSGLEGQVGTFIMATHVLLLKSSSLSNS